MKNNIDQHVLDLMSKNTDNWKGPFYFNRKDPRLTVPKYNPLMGMTLNFGNKYVFVALALIIAFIVILNFI